MAQYGLNRYGLSYYGYSGVITGSFESEIVDAGYTIQSNTGVEIRAQYSDIVATYTVSSEIFYDWAGTWINDGSNKQSTASDNIVKIAITGSDLFLAYSGSANYDIKKYDSTNDTWTSVKSGTLTSNTSVTMTDLGITSFGNYIITITTTSSTFVLSSVRCKVAHVDVYLKSATSIQDLETAQYELLTIKSKTSSSEYVVAAYNADQLKTKRYYRFKLVIMCSDDDYDIYVKQLDIETLDNDKYVEKAEYNATAQIPVDLESFDKIDWDSVEPTGTRIEIRTASVAVPTATEKLSPIYVKNKKELRLNNNETVGYAETPELTLSDFPYMKSIENVILDYMCDTLNFEPNTKNYIKYKILVKQNDGTYKELPNEHFCNINDISININTPFKIKLSFKREGEGIDYTPVLRDISVVCKSLYQESKTKDFTISSVDGEKNVCTLNSLGFTIPTSVEKINLSVTTNSSDIVGQYIAYFKDPTKQKASETTNITIDKNTNIDLFAHSKEKILYAIRNVKAYYNTVSNKLEFEEVFSNSFENETINTQFKYKYKLENGVCTFSKRSNGTWYYTKDGKTYNDRTIKFVQSSTNTTTIAQINDSVNNDTIFLEINPKDEITELPWNSDEIFSEDIYINSNGIKLNVLYKLQLPAIESGVYVDDKNVYNPSKINNLVWKAGPYKFEILKNSIKYFIEGNDYIDAPQENIDKIEIKSVVLVEPNIYDGTKIKPQYIIIDKITRGLYKNSDGSVSNIDKISYPFVKSQDFILVTSSNPTGKDVYNITSTYVKGVDYVFNDTTNEIIWLTNNKPANGSQYYAVYGNSAPTYAEIELSCDYYNEYSELDVWMSNKKYTVTGTCTPTQDYTSQDLNSLYPLPKNNLDTEYWPDLPENIKLNTVKYIIDDIDNKFIRAYIKNNKLHATLDGLDLSKHWIPKIKPGYYYIGKNEYYLYSSQKTEVNEGDITKIENCNYARSTKTGSGALVITNAITNLISNSEMDNIVIGTNSTITMTSDLIKTI